MFCSSCGKQTSDTSAFCGSCGRPVVGYSVGGSSTASATPAYAGAAAGGGSIAVGGVAQAGTTAYAGFWLRVVATIIDNLIVYVPFGFLMFLSVASIMPTLMRGANGNPRDPQFALAIMSQVFPRVIFMVISFIVGTWLYWALMESSSWQATLGKKALGLYVTDVSGGRPSFGRASGRFFAGRGIAMFVPYAGLLYRLIDCILAGFTERKQALHDMIAGCLVLRDN
jgi:uncharacterized RDD family membrane protein YckC